MRRPLLWVVAALLATGCGIPLDDAPRAIGSGDQDAETDRTPAGGGDIDTFTYYVLDGQLVAVSRSVEGNTPLDVLQTAITPPTPSEERQGLVTQIPAGTTIRAVRLADGRLNVDLSSEFEDVVGASRQQAIAQLVYGATELGDVREVSFSIEGTPLNVSSASRGDVPTVADCDFRALLAPDDAAREAGVGDDAVSHLAARREAADAACPEPTTQGP